MHLGAPYSAENTVLVSQYNDFWGDVLLETVNINHNFQHEYILDATWGLHEQT